MSRGGEGGLPWRLRLSCPEALWDLSSPNRDRTHVPYIARRILNCWTTGGIPWFYFELISELVTVGLVVVLEEGESPRGGLRRPWSSRGGDPRWRKAETLRLSRLPAGEEVSL